MEAGQAAIAPLDVMAKKLAASLRSSGASRIAFADLAGADGAPSQLGRYLTDELLTRMAALGGDLVFVERTRLREVAAEHDLGETAQLDQATKVGKLLGARAIIVGTVTVMAGFVDVNVRAVDVETAVVISTAGVELQRGTLAPALLTKEKVSQAPPLTLSTLFLGERKVGERYQEVVLRDGGMLRSGDGLKIVFQTSREAHVYALLLDSAGKASVIFPGDDFELANRVKAGKQVELPPGDLWFFLDDQPGTETIYVLASLKPMPQIAALATRLEAMGAGRDDRVADREVAEFVSRGAVKRRKKKKKKKRPILIAGVVRGIGGVKKGSVTRVKLSDGSEVKQAQEMLTGEGAVVRALSFRHE